MAPIYLDHHATTPCDPRVVEAMIPVFSTIFGNASSRQHAFGRAARRLVEEARAETAELIGASAAEVIFTSGATESDNLAIKGVAAASRGRHVITSRIEHRAVLDSCQRLEASGYEVTYLPVGRDGRVGADELERAIRPDTVLVTILFASNEIGTVQPVRESGEICKRRGILFHCDAVQALPHLACNVQELGIDLLSISAHKMYGPKGIGALYVRRRDPRVRLAPLFDGGGHERRLRPGTLNVPGIVGLGKACGIVRKEREVDAARIARLRDRLQTKILQAFPEAVVNGSLEHRLANNLNVSFRGLASERLLEEVPEVAASSGAACTTAPGGDSYVLQAISDDPAIAEGAIRFGLGRFNTEEEIDLAAERVVAAVTRVREEGPGPRGSAACS